MRLKRMRKKFLTRGIGDVYVIAAIAGLAVYAFIGYMTWKFYVEREVRNVENNNCTDHCNIFDA